MGHNTGALEAHDANDASVLLGDNEIHGLVDEKLGNGPGTDARQMLAIARVVSWDVECVDTSKYQCTDRGRIFDSGWANTKAFH
jgi:hypothetical protein